MTNQGVNRVLLPVSNPTTAPELLLLASNLVKPAGGRVFVLFVNISGRKPYPNAQENVSRIVRRARLLDYPVELVERSSISVARGILDASRELNANLILLGFTEVRGGKAVLGDVIESVAEVSRADLLIYRTLRSGHIEKILLPAANRVYSPMAVRYGLTLADSMRVPLNVRYIRNDPNQTLDQMLTEIPEEVRRRIKRIPIDAPDMATGLSRLDTDTTMIVMGFYGDVQEWLSNPVAQQLIARSNGPVLITKGATDDNSWRQRTDRAVRQFIPVMTQSEQAELALSAQEMALSSTNFMVLVVVSAVLASLGLLQNSSAVIIGAMLVAPLMSPLMGFGVAMARGQLNLMRRAILTVATGIGLVLVTSAIIGLLAPVKIPTPEMLGRGQPTILDMGVALASGVVGAFALSRKDIPAAVAGVAIAAALVPPICVAGLAFAFGAMNLFFGSFILFSLNVICIGIAAYATFALLGIHSENPTRFRQSFVSLVMLAILSIPLTLALVETVVQTNQTLTARNILEDQFPEFDVTDIEIEQDDPLHITATLRGARIPAQEDLESALVQLEDELNEDIDLQIVHLRILSGEETD